METTVQEQLEKFESPGDLLSDIPTSFSGSSLPIGFSTLETAEYFRAKEPDLIVLAARPACGKSALLCQMALNLAYHEPAVLFSLEMDKRQIKGRLMAMASEIPIRELRYADPAVLADAEEKISNASLFIDDTNGLDVNTLYSRAVARHKRNPVGAVFVDYLQIVGSASGRSKAEEVDFVTRRLKELALELRVPVIAAAQMNRNLEGRISASAKKELITPIMSDLADSAGIEKWSDVIIFLHRQFVNGAQSKQQIGGYVAKNRHGATTDFKLLFKGEYTKFYDRGLIDDGI